MSYQIEISKNELRNLIFALTIIPCLLFSAGFLTASLSQDSGHTQAAPSEIVADTTSSNAGLPKESAMEITPIPEPEPENEPAIPDPVSNTRDLATSTPPVPESPATQDRHFSVQTAAFQSASNAINFAAQLKAKGYPAEVSVQMTTPETPVYKVVYGTFAHEDAAKAAIAFTQQEKIPAFVIARS